MNKSHIIPTPIWVDSEFSYKDLDKKTVFFHSHRGNEIVEREGYFHPHPGDNRKIGIELIIDWWCKGYQERMFLSQQEAASLRRSKDAKHDFQCIHGCGGSPIPQGDQVSSPESGSM